MSKLKPLDGITIIAIEQYGAGPYGSAYLADLGANVIKIEQPQMGGDVSRQTGPFFIAENDSYFYQTFNGNKHSLGIDLKTKEGTAIFHQLVSNADAVTNNLRGDQAVKLGLDYQSLKHINAKIVCGHLSAYGRDNDRASWPGYDYLMQAEAGLMSLTGEADTPPTRFGVSMVDFMTGSVASMGLLAGIIGAGKTGQGCDVDVSLFDVALHQLSYLSSWYFNCQHITERMPRSAHPAAVPCQLYKTADGYIFIMAMTDKFWRILVNQLGTAELDNELFASTSLRSQHRDQIQQLLDKIFSKENTSHWIGMLQGKIPCAAVNSFESALNNPYIERIGMVQSVDHHSGKRVTKLANPIKIDNQRLSTTAAEALGASTDSILLELGLTLEQIRKLRLLEVII
ncbi:CaiB/BaiF CoA-transferase family protein [Paraferrimonas sp. SM1919]|uniref:CaiB/BaiF CoA transferase family protein n=1 Tax=Paraferrimonas sp. SM1919 TaxID=2662263 RepID=UPI0013D2A9A7|nr:CoA transferase [Paraferrimonas sp. SM1919]